MIQNYTDKRPRCVYGYFDEENMVAYIGLTVNKKQRHYSHKNGVFSSKSSKSPVYEYFTSQNKLCLSLNNSAVSFPQSFSSIPSLAHCHGPH